MIQFLENQLHNRMKHSKFYTQSWNNKTQNYNGLNLTISSSTTSGTTGKFNILKREKKKPTSHFKACKNMHSSLDWKKNRYLMMNWRVGKRDAWTINKEIMINNMDCSSKARSLLWLAYIYPHDEDNTKCQKPLWMAKCRNTRNNSAEGRSLTSHAVKITTKSESCLMVHNIRSFQHQNSVSTLT